MMQGEERGGTGGDDTLTLTRLRAASHSLERLVHGLLKVEAGARAVGRAVLDTDLVLVL